MAAESAPAVAPAVVYRWDLDKTYLQTEFENLRGLLRAATEGAGARRTVPGMQALLTALSRWQPARIVVVSGSPTFLRERFEEMFRLHGVRCDKLVLKDFVGAVARGRFRTLKAQLPYKLRAHLETRNWLAGEQADVPEICFGDDAEIDALVYCLYADVCSRRVDATRLRALLEQTGAYADEVAAILQALSRLPRHDPVRRVFIHLDGRSPPARFHAYRGRATATFDALQIAVSLVGDGLADDAVLRAVADELVGEHRIDAHALAGSLEDACRRGLCSAAAGARVAVEVLPTSAAGGIGFDAEFGERVGKRLVDGPAPAQAPTPLPYEELFAAEHRFARARKLARRAAERVPGLGDFLSEDD